MQDEINTKWRKEGIVFSFLAIFLFGGNVRNV
jgi:hypothetical protein